MIPRLIFIGHETDACSPIDIKRIENWPVQEPVILMVDRGNCAFAMKVWNSQNAGARAVIIADDPGLHHIVPGPAYYNTPPEQRMHSTLQGEINNSHYGDLLNLKKK